MVIPMTSNDSTKEWHSSGWRLIPLNVPLLEVAQSSTGSSIVLAPPDEMYPQIKLPLPGNLAGQHSYGPVFEMLLRDYAHIWKALAGR